MRVLFLSPALPYPADSGGTIKTSTILTYLGQRHEVHVLCFRRGPQTQEQARWCASVGQVETVPLNRGRTTLNLVRSYMRGIPLSIERNRSREMAALVSKGLREGGYEAVFVDSWLMAQYLLPEFSGLTLLHEHNAEHVMWFRQAQRERNPLLRALTRLEYQRVRRYEASILPAFDIVLAVSETDRQALIQLGAEAERLQLLPNLPEQSLLERPGLSFGATEPMILYFGTLSWQPNLDGLEHFLRSVFPLVRQRMPEVRFVVAGKESPAWLQRLASGMAGVEFVGPVEDVEPLYRRARLFVEASPTGGGTRLKVLNALARGLPVVASSQGAEGLDAVPGEHLLVTVDTESTVEAVCRLMTDDALWRALSENGRALIRARYLAEVAYRPLDEVLSSARPTA